MKKKSEEPEYELIEGKIINFVEEYITIKEMDRFITVPTSRILKIKHKKFGAEYSLSDKMEGLNAELYLIPMKKCKPIKPIVKKLL